MVQLKVEVWTMNIEHIEIEHNKAITIVLALLILLFTAGLVACVALIGVNFNDFSNEIGRGLVITITILLSLCILECCILFIGQISKIHRKIIFIADENGIYDYTRHIVLKPIYYSEILSIEYKEYLSDDVSDIRHLKINLKNEIAYMKRLNLLQKISYLLRLRHIELHMFCAKTKIKDLAIKLKQNLEIYNQINS